MKFPDVEEVKDDDDEIVEWNSTDLAKEIRDETTPAASRSIPLRGNGHGHRRFRFKAVFRAFSAIARVFFTSGAEKPRKWD